MSGAGMLHPLFAEILRVHGILPRSHRTVALDPEGRDVETCGRCGNTGREWGGDSPCTCEAGEPGRKASNEEEQARAQGVRGA